MKTVLRLLFATLCLLSLALPAVADEEGDDLENDARHAEGAPPTIPHRVEANATGESCLACHRSGLNGAPITPHPLRLDCVQCHVQGETAARDEGKKGKKHKKQRSDGH
jgi:nitrate reductase cytochrome c-type subunit